MAHALQSLIRAGTKLWIDSVDPDLVKRDVAAGATGATSNPVIISDLIKTGRFDSAMQDFFKRGMDDEGVAWELTNKLVSDAERVFFPIWERTRGDDGYTSFELNPLLEDPVLGPPVKQRVQEYIRLGIEWAKGHPNRMIKVPATEAGILALEELTAAGVTLNVTLIFTADQYRGARDSVWRGAKRRNSLQAFKSVYSIFVSRIDIYTEEHVPTLSAASQGEVGIVNAKRIWQDNEAFWKLHPTPLRQEIIFASTGTKKPSDPPWKYVDALAGSDIQTNPPATNLAADSSGREFTRRVDTPTPPAIAAEIDAKVDFKHMHEVLMREGIEKFANPQKALLALIAKKRSELQGS
jgi:transaldolase